MGKIQNNIVVLLLLLCQSMHAAPIAKSYGSVPTAIRIRNRGVLKIYLNASVNNNSASTTIAQGTAIQSSIGDPTPRRIRLIRNGPEASSYVSYGSTPTALEIDNKGGTVILYINASVSNSKTR